MSSSVSRYLRNSIPVGASGVISLSLNFLGLAFVVRMLGEDRMGFFFFVQAVSGTILALVNFSFTTAAAHRVSASYPQGDVEGARDAMGLNLIASLLVGGALCLIALVGLRWLLPFAKVTPALLEEARIGYLVLILAAAIQQISAAYQIIPLALHRLDALSIVSASFAILSFGATVGAVYLVPTLPMYAEVLAVFALLRLAADFCLARYVFGQWLLPRWNAAEGRRLGSFAGWVYLQSATSALGGMADKFIITGYVGSAQLAYYGLAQRLMGQVHGGLYGLTQTLFPTFAAMGENLATAIRRRGDAIAWMLGLLVLSAYGAELAAGPLIFKRVVGASFFQKVWPFFILATVYGIALGFGLLAWYLSLGANQPRINSLMSVGYGLVAFPLLFLAVSRLGALGAALVQLLMVLNTVAHLLWIRRIVTGAGESGWRALRSAFAPFMPWAVTGAAWLGIASYLVLVAHVGIVGYTLLVLVGGAATMLAIVWYERGRQSGRYALLAATTQMMVRGFEAAFRWGRERVASV